MVNILASLLPIFLFLIALVFLDSYKLVKFRSILLAIGIGCIVALASYYVNTFIIERFRLYEYMTFYRRYPGPLIEEVFKMLFVVYLIKSKKIGFMVDAAIYGFAIGAGFGFIENINYLLGFPEETLLFWLIRGCGTAMMHGGATAILSVLARHMDDRYPGSNFKIFLPGLLIAIAFHSVYNHFTVGAIPQTILILLILPAIMIIIFKRSEESTRSWLGKGLDSDVELIDLIMSGNVTESRIGKYLRALITKFPSEIIGDMLCFIRIHTELSMAAKGILLLRKAGFEPSLDNEVKEKLNELSYLEKRIGKTGKLAISPILHKSDRSEWQLNLIKK
jgi:RsiW-degrading membrane proteinase PrsW (M82 family)